MLTVRGIYENGEIKLKEKISISRKIPVFITFLENMEKEKEKDRDGVYHDLDYLAGTWTEEDDREFLQAAEDFDKIDEELWK